MAKSISDASWGELVRQLEYKSSWYGTRVKKIGRFEPSSKTCHRCAYVKTDLSLKREHGIARNAAVI
ncbi:MAG: transposase [Treponema sp.]|nr:transposase [Treponema sp.]